MISNERRWPSRPQYQPHYQQPYHQQPPPQQRPFVQETMHASREIQIERKEIRIMLKENNRGAFVRITENSHGKMNSIMVPLSGLKDFQKLLGEMVQANAAILDKSVQAQP